MKSKTKKTAKLDDVQVHELCEESTRYCGVFHDTALIVASQLERDGHLKTATQAQIEGMVKEAWKQATDPDLGSAGLGDALTRLALLIFSDSDVRMFLAGQAKELGVDGLD